jgi:hypothetical protein
LIGAGAIGAAATLSALLLPGMRDLEVSATGSGSALGDQPVDPGVLGPAVFVEVRS